jgi:hypothetical protein
LLQSMALVACLLAHREQAIASNQALPEFVVDRRWRGPGRRLSFDRKAEGDLVSSSG